MERKKETDMERPGKNAPGKALVTGASSGIGMAIARVLIDLGYDVCGIGRDFSGLDSAIASSGHFRRVELDLTDEHAFHRFLHSFNPSGLSVLVNCAGSAWYGMHEEMNEKKIREMTRVDLEVPMILCSHFLREIRKNRGAVINISSVTAVDGAPHAAVYGALKSGLYSFSRSLLAENRKFGVRVISILPDMTESRLYRNADFRPKEDCALSPEQVAEAVRYALRDPKVLVDTVVLRPQYHGIERKKH